MGAGIPAGGLAWTSRGLARTRSATASTPARSGGSIRPALRDQVQHALDIGGFDFGHKPVLPVWLDQLAQHGCLIGGIAGRQMRGMFA